MFRRSSLATFFLAVAAMAGCSGPPDKERQQADAALTAARAADAVTYAPTELHAAQSALDRYDEAVAQHDYRQALSLATEARDTAYDAARKAADEKATLRTQAEKALGDLEMLSRAATARLSGASGPKPSGQAADRLRTATRTASTALQEARAHIAHQEYQAAVTAMTPSIDALRRLTEPPAPASSRKTK